MAREYPVPPKLSELQQRQDRLKQIRDRRVSWKRQFEDKAGTGTLEEDVYRVSRAIDTANKSVTHYDNKIAMNAVSLYQEEANYREGLMERLRRNTDEQIFPKKALAKREKEHTIFLRRKETDPQLQQGETLLSEAASPPSITETIADDSPELPLPDITLLHDNTRPTMRIYGVPLIKDTIMEVRGKVQSQAANIINTYYRSGQSFHYRDIAERLYGPEGEKKTGYISVMMSKLKELYAEHGLEIIHNPEQQRRRDEPFEYIVQQKEESTMFEESSPMIGENEPEYPALSQGQQ